MISLLKIATRKCIEQINAKTAIFMHFMIQAAERIMKYISQFRKYIAIHHIFSQISNHLTFWWTGSYLHALFKLFLNLWIITSIGKNISMVPTKKVDSNYRTFQEFFYFFQDFLHQSSRTFLGLSTKFQDFPGLLRSCTNSHNKNFIFAK